MLVSYMPLAANARELDELGSRNKPTSPDVGGCRERFYLGGGMLVCCYERRGPRPPPMNRRRAISPTALPHKQKTHYISYFFLQ